MNFTEEQLALLATNNVTPEEASKVIEMFPQELDTAIGYILGLRNAQGQERNESFQTQAEADAQVSGDPNPASEAQP